MNERKNDNRVYGILDKLKSYLRSIYDNDSKLTEKEGNRSKVNKPIYSTSKNGK